jgi:hypothetical protein
MTKVKRDVKSKGTVVATVEINVVENFDELLKTATKDQILSAYNRCVATDAMNAARVSQVRPMSPAAQLAKMAKADPKVKARIDALLAELGAVAAGKPAVAAAASK